MANVAEQAIGWSGSETQAQRALGAVADIARYAGSGDEAMASQARRTLDQLCWSVDGYPAAVRAALRAAGLRETP